MIDGETFPIQAVLPVVKQSTNYYQIGDRLFNKTWAISLAAAHDTVTCAICNKPAVCFKFYKYLHGSNNVIKLVFEHKDHNGNLAFMTVDHIIPKSKGGTSDPQNLQLTCNVCNEKKGSKIDFAVKKGIPIPEHQSGSWINRLSYIAYIRWYIKMYEQFITVKGWNNGSIHMFRGIKKILVSMGDFDTLAYSQAKLEIHHLIQQHKCASLQTKIVDLFDKV